MVVGGVLPGYPRNCDQEWGDTAPGDIGMSKSNGALLVTAFFALTIGAAAAAEAIVERNLVLRGGPGTQHRSIVVMPQGSVVALGRCTGDWCRVNFRGNAGFAHAGFLKFGAESFAQAAGPATFAAPTSNGARLWRWEDRDARDRQWRERQLRNQRQGQLLSRAR